VRGNYCTLNPLDFTTVGTISNGNLRFAQSSSAARSGRATFGVSSGKWYWETNYVATGTNGATVGVTQSTLSIANQYNWVAGGVGYRSNNGYKNVNGTGQAAYGATWTTGDVIGVTLDVDGGTITFYKNGSSQGALSLPTLATGAYWLPGFTNITSAGTQTLAVNFGQQPFTYTPPSGFKSLCTTNLPTPTIGATVANAANKNFDATLYTGTGANQTITNAGGFQPDFVWAKVRSTTGTHVLTDSIRGGNNQIFTNLTAAQATATNKITGFTSTGFTLGADDGTGTGDANFNGSTYVAWQWNAGGANTTNTNGTTSAIVRANQSAGFSVVSYAGNSSTATVGHGLASTPGLIIIKNSKNTKT
jgi:hypothetical protein